MLYWFSERIRKAVESNRMLQHYAGGEFISFGQPRIYGWLIYVGY